MNKKDIKASIDSIAPDSHLKTRIKAKVESGKGCGIFAQKRLALSTVAACAAIVALGVGLGTNMNFAISNDVNLSTNHANADNENLDATDFVPATTERIIYSQEEIEEDLGYTIPNVQADPNDSSIAVSNPFTPPVITDTKLIVLGKDISDGNHPHFFKTKNYVELPFAAILNELADTEITWISDTKAAVVIDGVSYTLNIDNQCTFVKDGTQENIFTPSPYVGDAPYYKVVDGELIIDNTTLSGLINYLGHVMVVDYDAKTVTIV